MQFILFFILKIEIEKLKKNESYQFKDLPYNFLILKLQKLVFLNIYIYDIIIIVRYPHRRETNSLLRRSFFFLNIYI
jgi:hypothetical protein